MKHDMKPSYVWLVCSNGKHGTYVSWHREVVEGETPWAAIAEVDRVSKDTSCEYVMLRRAQEGSTVGVSL